MRGRRNHGFILNGFSPELAVVREVQRIAPQLPQKPLREAQLIQQF